MSMVWKWRDWLLKGRADRISTGGGRPMILDVKKCQVGKGRREDCQRAIENYGYHRQAAWYMTAVRALGLAAQAAFVFIVQMKTAPYLVTLIDLDTEALRLAEQSNRRALEIYRDCVATDEWPGYSRDITLISLPAWARYAEETL